MDAQTAPFRPALYTFIIAEASVPEEFATTYAYPSLGACDRSTCSVTQSVQREDAPDARKVSPDSMAETKFSMQG
jgi:hypothetical protein